jgi:hypothetical protein
MAPAEQVSRIWALETDTGKLRVHVAGTSVALDRVGRRLREDTPDRTNRETLLAWLKEVLAEESATLADRLDRPESDQPRDLAARIRAIQHLTDVSRAFTYLLALFEVSGSTEIDHLIASPDLVWVRSYIESVLRDLDENEDDAFNQLREALDPHAAYILLPS